MSHGATTGAPGHAPKARKTLVEQASEVHIRDPAQHTRHQVSELDKQAKGSMMKRKFRLEQIDADNKEIAHINEEIRSLRVRPLFVTPRCFQIALTLFSSDFFSTHSLGTTRCAWP